jgi:hypothetical protein
VFVVPQLLIAEGIPFKTIRQLPGDYVITFPGAFATTGDQTLDQTSVEEYMPLLHHLPRCKVFFVFFFNFDVFSILKLKQALWELSANQRNRNR